MQHCWLLLLLLLGTQTFWGPTAAQSWGTEISSSVSLFRTVELTQIEFIDGKLATRCEHMVDRAGQTGSTKVNFVISHFFVDENNDNVPDSYCYKPDSSETCLPFTQEIIDEWVRKFIPCLAYAIRAGFDIAVTPHLDDGLNGGGWRNAQKINPLAKYGGMSYTEMMLLPLADALAATLTADTTVWFALQGEMSVMVTSYPAEHQKLLPFIKQRILGNHPEWAGNIRMGVSTNYNKLCGMNACVNPTPAQKTAMQSLYSAVDFVGMSAYPRYQRDLKDMEDATEIFDNELSKAFGIDLAELITTGGKELVFNEFGIGGGVTAIGDTPARTEEQAASFPFFGVYGPYTRKLDPWRNSLPDTVLSDTRQYLETWYQAACLWLARKGGPRWRVDHVFLWNLNSWDVQGVHMQSNTKEGTYRNEVVSRTIKSHNLATRGLSGLDNPGSFPTY